MNENTVLNKLIKSNGKRNPKSKIIFLSFSITGIVKVESNTFTGMNANTRYVCYIRHKQAAVNKWISKLVKKNPTGNLKNHFRRNLCAVKDF